MKKIVVFLGILMVFLTGCGYKYADRWQIGNFTIEDAYAASPGLENSELAEILTEDKGYIASTLNRDALPYLLWQNYDEVEILQVESFGETNMSEETADAYYSRKDNTIYVTDSAIHKGHDYLIGTVCHELMHTLTWTENFDSMLSEGIADFYTMQILLVNGISYDMTYASPASAVFFLDACYPREFLELAMSGKLVDRIDQDLGKKGIGRKLTDAISATYYYDAIAPDTEKCYEAANVQLEILAHLATKTEIDPDMAINLIEGYHMDDQEYFTDIIKKARY